MFSKKEIAVVGNLRFISMSWAWKKFYNLGARSFIFVFSVIVISVKKYILHKNLTDLLCKAMFKADLYHSTTNRFDTKLFYEMLG